MEACWEQQNLCIIISCFHVVQQTSKSSILAPFGAQGRPKVSLGSGLGRISAARRPRFALYIYIYFWKPAGPPTGTERATLGIPLGPNWSPGKPNLGPKGASLTIALPVVARLLLAIALGTKQHIMCLALSWLSFLPKFLGLTI